MSDVAEGPGATLKDARVALDVTTREVADALNLPVSVVEAMEANDYERLPQPVFTRGYLRSYARLLELDPAAIVARYPVAADETFETGELERVAPEQTKAPAMEKKVLAALGALVLALLLIVWLLPGDEAPEGPVQAPEVTAPEATATEATATEPAAIEAAASETAASMTSTPRASQAPEAGDPSSRDVSRGAAPTPVPERAIEPADVRPLESRAASSEEAAAVTAAAEVAEPSEPAPEVEPDATTARELDAAVDATLEAPTPAGFRRITPFGDDELVLTFAEDCWVQVRDLDGVNLYGDLNRAGGTLRLIGRAPFRVRLGYAPGATLELNGDVVSLTRYTRNNVANVVVGR